MEKALFKDLVVGTEFFLAPWDKPDQPNPEAHYKKIGENNFGSSGAIWLKDPKIKKGASPKVWPFKGDEVVFVKTTNPGK